jgi:hypothetical protein
MNQKEESSRVPAVPASEPGSATGQKPTEAADFEKWLEHFYKECGREATLAYTTLNQMKNWAVLIVGAIVSAVVAMQRSNRSAETNDIPIYFAAVIAYVFTLRFFVRAILCYINLVRWNNLQEAMVALKIVHPSPKRGKPSKTTPELKADLLKKIDDLYFKWRAPSRLTRPAQLFANLKLGFGLLLALAIFVAIAVGIDVIPASRLALGITVFALCYTLIEALDFLASGYFDTPERAAIKLERHSVFPTPITGPRYVVLLILAVVVSSAVSLWPQIVTFLRSIFSCR